MSTRSGTGGGLRADALGTYDMVVMAIAGCGPAYTVAGTIPALIAAVGVAGPAALLYCAIPVIGIALAYRQLGRVDPNAGAAYSWVARSLHPFLGFLCGWSLVVACIVFMASSTVPAGSATLSLVAPALADDPLWAAVVGSGWFLLMAGVVAYGARIGARSLGVITAVQLVLLTGVAVGALLSDGSGTEFSPSWFGFGHFEGQESFVKGALIATFAFWGWDVTSNLGEETRRGSRGSGFGGVIGVVLVFVLFVLTTVAVNVLMTPDAVRNSPDGLLVALGQQVWPGVGGTLLILALLLSTVAMLETALIQAGRTLFAMGRDRTLPHAFGRIHAKRHTPWVATAAIAVVACTLAIVEAAGRRPGDSLLSDAVSGVGLHVTLYYSLAGLGAVVVHRKLLRTSAANFLLMGLWPFAGALFMLWIMTESVAALSTTALTIGFGTLALGLLPMFTAWLRQRPYFEPGRLDAGRARAVDDAVGGGEIETHVIHAAGSRDELLTDF
ncbi:putative amino acid permease [Streptomyces xantholiticus]|nr:APC family permease [Streptomyces xantholiticus]GGW49095.1 putative amino acid permease [Streptomyces xantholiticus]